jgi:glutamyl-tRNA reductase
MNLISVSINHRTSPVEIRESLHIGVDEIKQINKELQERFFSESFILSTCNRTEIYGIFKDSSFGFVDILNFLVDKKNTREITERNFESFSSFDALRHLFMVSSGIDSSILGDNQIFGQVKEAFQTADEMKSAGFLLKRIFDSAIRVGKRAKTETEISDGAVTVSYAAVQLIEKIFSNLNRKSALVIGAGETGEIAAKHLHDKGIGNLSVTNRTISKAEKLADMINAEIIPFQHFKDHLHEFDIVISATSAPGTLLNYEDVKNVMKKRNNAATCLVDIAVPRDIDSHVKNIDNIFYHDIDSLNIIVEQNLKKRQAEVPKVLEIISEELENFINWYNSLEVAPVIKLLRDHFEIIRSEEVEKQKNRFSSEDFEKIDIVTKKIINKLLHTPTVELKKVLETGSDNRDPLLKINILKELFGLKISGNGENKK